MEMENNKCDCLGKFKEPKFVLAFLGIIFLGAIVILSILRERIVNPEQNIVTVFGQGRASYQPDTAEVTVGVRVDRVFAAEDALNQLNDKIGRTIVAIKTLGIKEEDIKTESYTLSPQYDYREGTTSMAGYNADQHLIVKVKDMKENPDLVNNVISAAGGAGTNQILGVNFSVSNVNDLKQEARIKAIEDARGKAGALFKASGIKRAGKVVGWYENVLQSPDVYLNGYGTGGIGGASGAPESARSVPSPQVPSGTQEIVIEIGVNYEVK